MPVKFTPLSIKNQDFAKAIQGYKVADVRIFLQQVADYVDSLLQEKQMLQNEIAAQKKRLDVLEKHATTVREAMAEQMGRLNAQSEARAEEIISEAQTEAQHILRDMQIELDKKREELFDLSGIYASFKQHLIRHLETLARSVEEFESAREARKANAAICELLHKDLSHERLDPIQVLQNTNHRRRRKAFLRYNFVDENE